MWTLIFFFLNAGPGPNLPTDAKKTEIHGLESYEACVQQAHDWGEAPEHEGLWFCCVPPAVSALP
jgi:hypothetical protein